MQRFGVFRYVIGGLCVGGGIVCGRGDEDEYVWFGGIKDSKRL